MRTLKRAEWPQKAAKISHEEHKVTKDQPRRTQRSRRIRYTGTTATKNNKDIFVFLVSFVADSFLSFVANAVEGADRRSGL